MIVTCTHRCLQIMSDEEGKLGAKNARRRVQNRISQQCRRERGSAKARHLHRLAIVQSMSTMNYEDRYSALLQEHLKLIDDNESLREALLGLRKRFLSLSAAATAAAEDSIFNKLLEKDTKKASDVSQQLIVPEALTSNADEAMSMPRVSTPDTNAGNAICNYPSPLLPNPDPAYSLNAFVGQNIGNSDNNIFALDNPAYGDEFSIRLNFIPSFDLHEIYVHSPTEFADKVLSVCRQYLKDDISTAPPCPAPPREVRNELLSQQVAAAAIRFLSRAAGIEPYVYHTGRANYLEKIIRWRLSTIPDDGTAIPRAFAPTRLQHRQNAGAAPHHLLVDFICWPEIRDQVILNVANLDLDDLQRDIVLNTVLEAPQYGVALGVFDLINNWIHDHHQPTNGQSSSYVRNSEWIFFKAPGKRNYPDIECDPVESAILQELKFIVQQQNAATLSELATTSEPGINTGYNATCTLNSATLCEEFVSSDTAVPIGLYLAAQDTSSWKLSKGFAIKYPMIDCSSGKEGSP
ncbi:hypothetical protein GGI35DRAFT_485940 [Trichoderma velutinum]